MMKRILWILVAFCLIVSGPASVLAQPVSSNPATAPKLELIRSDENGVILELTTSNYEIVSQEIPAGDFDEILLPETVSTSEPGKPQVPFVSTLIGVPPNAEIQLRVLQLTDQDLRGTYHLIPAPSLAASLEEFSPGEMVYRVDEAAYTTDELYPAKSAAVTDEAWVRDQRIARIELHPFQYNPAQRTLQWNRQIRVEVRFVYDSPEAQALASAAKVSQESAFAPVLEASLLNYETAKNWQGLPKTQIEASSAPFAQTQSLGLRYRIAVDQDGLYEITYADLAAVMADIDTVNPQNFQFSSQGANVDILVVGEDDGSFDEGDKIIFYGQKFYGDRHAARYADANANWNTYNQQQPDGSYLPWKPAYNALMVEKYTDENVYWLIVGDSPGSRMETVNGDPSGNLDDPVPNFRATVHAEENKQWKTDHDNTEDTWFWERILDKNPRAYSTTLTSIATEPFSVTLRSGVLADYNYSHHTTFRFNGYLIDDTWWEGESLYQFEALMPYSYLQVITNTIQFDVSTDSDPGGSPRYYINWFEIDYDRLFEAQDNQLWFSQPAAGTHKYEITDFSDTSDVFFLDVTTPLTPTQILSPTIISDTITISATNTVTASYFVASSAAVLSPTEISYYEPPDLYATTNAGEYVFITHADLVTATQTLANDHAGLTTMVIDAQDLYNEFNDGIYNPIAIKNFLAYALANWDKPPEYALLVGDGNWNFKAYNTTLYGNPGIIYMPPNLAWVDPWQGEVDATNLLAAVVGTDPLPDLNIARLPVSSATELNTYTAKLTAYESAPTSQSWQYRMLFLADNYDPKAGDFSATSDNIIDDYLTASIFHADRIYQDDYGCVSSGSAQCVAMNAAIINTLNITGTLIMSYHGHGSNNRWSDELILDDYDVPSLTNGNQLPVMLSLDCLDGYWYFPPASASHALSTSLAEEMVLAANKGAIAAFSPSGLGVGTGHSVLHSGFLETLVDDGIWEMGPAVLNAKLRLYNSGASFDLIQTFTIIGDPALHILGENLEFHGIYLPLIQK